MDVLAPLGGFGYGLVAQSANITATNTTTNQTLATFQVRANGWAVQDTYHFWARLHASRGATAAASNLVIEMVVNAAVVRTLTLAIPTTATNRMADVIGLLTCRSVGAGGTIQTQLMAYHDITGTAGAVLRALDPVPGTAHPVTSVLDTTAARTLELRCRMSAPVLALTLYSTHAGIRRLK
jgi:hypothetical protein